MQESETSLSHPFSSTRSRSSKMEPASRVNESSFKRMSGQRTTNSSPTLTDSSMESVWNPAYESSPASESPFRSGFDTPQSSVVNITLRQAAQPRRVTRFAECFCVSGGPCVGTGGQATCGCGLSPEAVKAPKKAKRRSIQRFTKAITKGLKKAWKRQIQAIKDGVGRVLRK